MDIIELIINKEIDLLQQEQKILLSIIDTCHDFTCAVCGKVIDRISTQRKTRGILWHNIECYQYKPRKIIALERIYGKDIVEILKETTRQYSDIISQCAGLSISIPHLYSIIRKYCGEDYIPFMYKYSIGKRKELYKNKVLKKCQRENLT